MADTVEIDILARVENAVSGLQKFITQVGAAYISYKGLKKLIGDSMTEFLAAEKAETQLAAAMKITGQYSRESFDSLKAYAEGLMLTSTYSHEATESAAALLMELTHMTTDGVKAAMPHLMNFASAVGMDLTTVAQMASAAVEGGRNAFIRYGISLKDAHDPTSRMTELIRQLSEKFSGMNAEMAKTTGGQLTILKNQMDEIKETLGGEIAALINPSLIKGIMFMRVFKLFDVDLAKASTAELKSATATLSEWLNMLNKESPLERKWNETLGDREVHMHNIEQLLAAFNNELSRRPKEADKPVVLVPPEQVRQATDLEKHIAAVSRNLYDMQELMAQRVGGVDVSASLADQANRWEALGEAATKTGAKIEAGMRDMAERWIALGAVSRPVSKDLSKFDKELENIGKTLVGSAGRDLASLFQEIGKGDDIAASLQKMGAALVSQIGELMIAAGLRLIIEGVIPAGLALLVAGGFTSIFGGVISGGGEISTGSSSLPHYQGGTDYVPRTGPAIVHQGEQIIPAGGSGRGSTQIVNVHVYGGMWQADQLARAITRAQGRW